MIRDVFQRGLGVPAQGQPLRGAGRRRGALPAGDAAARRDDRAGARRAGRPGHAGRAAPAPTFPAAPSSTARPSPCRRSTGAGGSSLSSRASTGTRWSTSTATTPGSAPTGTRFSALTRTVSCASAQDNEIRVEARAHQDSRWYTGAGIYRDTWLLTGGLVRIGPDGVRVTTPDIDAERAVVEVATRVENDSIAIRTARIVTEVRDAAGSVVAADVSPGLGAARASRRPRGSACTSARRGCGARSRPPCTRPA